MHGKFVQRTDAQLALMDAMVFFIVILAICGSMVSVVRMKDTIADDERLSDALDVSGLLSTYLRTSIASKVDISAYESLEMTGKESMADVILVLCDLILVGVDPLSLEPIPEKMLEVLIQVCPSFVRPHLIIMDVSTNNTQELLVLEETPSGGSYIDSASQRISGIDGQQLMVVLLLDPSFGS